MGNKDRKVKPHPEKIKDDWAKFDLIIHAEDKAILVYIDLCGTTDLYEKSIVPLKKQAERLFNALLDSFVNALTYRFSDDTIREKFYINIYADSIMLSLRKKEPNTIKQLLLFLLYFQWLLIIEHKAIPFRAVVAQNSYFSLHIDSISEDHIFSSKYIDVSLCGGRGMICLDEKLKGLPIGVYIEKSLIKDKSFDFDKSRFLTVRGESIFFVKQNKSHIRMLSSTASQQDITIDIARYFPNRHKKWDQWLSAHEGSIGEISREEKK